MRDKIEEAIKGLKDFQLKTVDYVFDQLYVKGRKKMLVADEVGLGKTIVAKGIIAKAFEKYLNDGGQTKENPTFNVVYICSNLALATQNIRKLNFLGDSNYVEETLNRLTYLAYKPDRKPPVFLINSLTPSTSFDEKSSQGEINERAIIFRLLTEYEYFKKRWNGLKWLLKGTRVKNIKTFEDRIDVFWKDPNFKIREDLFGNFRKALLETSVDENNFPRLFEFIWRKPDYNLWHAINWVCCDMDGRNHHRFDVQGEIIRHLRRILSSLCIKYLNADIFILDEFQRYNNLIKLDEEAENPAIELARGVFRIPEAKVLMLSATPFKPFTNDFDELNGEIHYKEFEAVLKFLMKNEKEEFWHQFQKDRKAFFSFLRQPDSLVKNISAAVSIKESLEEKYRKAFVRTERLHASRDGDALIDSVLKDKTLELYPEDIEDFANIDRLVSYLNDEHKTQLPVPVEYVKSSPFSLTFLDNYQHKKKLEEHAAGDDKLKELVKKTEHAWLNLKEINEYRPLFLTGKGRLPNAKLRLLLNESIENGGWKYLWIPPTVNYYEPEGAYKGSKNYSKSLVFSSWLLVPRMISSLVSYEAERYSVGNPDSISEREKREEKRNYFIKRRTPRPQITFKVEKDDQEPQRMRSFIYLYPSMYLSQIYFPSKNTAAEKTLNEIREEIKNLLRPSLTVIMSRYSRSGDNTDWQKWYWAAPLLLDREYSDRDSIDYWFDGYNDVDESAVDADDESAYNDEYSGKIRHFDLAGDVFRKPRTFKLPALNDEQFDKVLDFLTDLSLGSPAVCFLRALQNSFDGEDNIELLNSAFDVASSFVTLFNRPESIAVVRLTTKNKEYLDKVLEYSIDGNIQSMFDEFLYVLTRCENIHSPLELSEHISDVLSIRTSSIQVDDLQSFLSRDDSGKIRRSMRTHFAVDFGNQKLLTSKKSGRQINIRQAFNSPFRPFVLATTSIGQEGLDFHLYCKKIFHWNLPSNPIDFEQREGRIHRYLGLVIRQNVADKYVKELNCSNNVHVWQSLFEVAAGEKESAKASCELVPYWHTETRSNIKIERYVPLYPFSKDIERYRMLLKVLTYYRLTFGQPRQEELIEALYESNYSNEIKELLDKLLINLSPMNFKD